MRIQTCLLTALSGVFDSYVEFTGGSQVIRVYVLEHTIVRVVYLPDGVERLDRSWMVVDKNENVPLIGHKRSEIPSFFNQPSVNIENTKTDDIDGVLHIETEALSININYGRSFFIQWSEQGSNRYIASDIPGRSYCRNIKGTDVWHYMRRNDKELIYGLGEKSGPISKTNQHYIMKNVDALGYNAQTSDPLYKHWPFYYCFNRETKLTYGMFYDNQSTSIFDTGKEIDAYHGPYRYYRADNGDIDYYFIFGPTMKQVLQQFVTKITGRSVLPPRHMLGYLGSTMSYTESPNAQEQLAQFVQLCKQHKMPCDLFHLSSGYSTGSDGKRYVFTWNKSKVPNPKEMTKTFHDAGIKIAANVKPWLLTTHPDYEIVLQQKAFIRTCDTEYKPELSTLWSGGAFQSSDGAYFDFTNQQAYNWWKSKAKEQLLEYGIDMLWNDNNEFEIWDDDAQCNGFSSTIPIGLIRPIQTLLMNRASFEAQLEHAPTKRPFVLTRSGSPGLQRYAQTWSGDNFSDWNALQYNIPMGLSLSISGFFNTGHDTGGFAGPKPDQELFIRWIQSTIFNPRFCVHSWNTDNTVNELWMYPECIDHVRGLIQFRYKLIPYLYTSLYKSVKDAVPVIRPLVYEFPDDEKVHESSFEFMCGDSLLVACVTEHNATTKKIYLPKGAQWYRYGSTNETIPGGSTIQVDVSDIRTIPLFVRAGSIIPLEEEAGVLKLGVYLDGSNDCTYELFDDDGETNVTHEQYGYAMTTCRVQVENDIVCTASTKCFGGYQSRWKKIEFELYTLEKNVKVNIL